MVNWKLIWFWTKRILLVIGIIFLAIAFVGFLPGVNKVSLFPDYTNLIWFLVFLALGLLIIVPYVLNIILERYRLKKAIITSLKRNIRINDKEMASEIEIPVWNVTPMFKKLAPKYGLLVSFSGTPTFFNANFIDRLIKIYEYIGDLGGISREFAQKHSINISKDDLYLILDELIYLGHEKVIKLTEKWEKEKPKIEEEELKKPQKTIIKRLGETRRKKKKKKK
ncbi:MAG: hypothetical protein ACTSO9_05790 [Candidatus Helarchaeota archaeon]